MDGYDPVNNVAIEFLGCAVHAHGVENKNCPLSKGMSPSSYNPYHRRCSDVRNDLERRKKYLESRGLEVQCIYECEYMELKETDPDLREFLERFHEERPKERLALRDALRGGRTEAFFLYFAAEDDLEREAFYVDVNSLYPTVAVFNNFPCGRSEVFIGESLKRIVLGEEGTFVDTDRLVKGSWARSKRICWLLTRYFSRSSLFAQTERWSSACAMPASEKSKKVFVNTMWKRERLGEHGQAWRLRQQSKTATVY